MKTAIVIAGTVILGVGIALLFTGPVKEAISGLVNGAIDMIGGILP